MEQSHLSSSKTQRILTLHPNLMLKRQENGGNLIGGTEDSLYQVEEMEIPQTLSVCLAGQAGQIIGIIAVLDLFVLGKREREYLRCNQDIASKIRAKLKLDMSSIIVAVLN